MSAVINIIETTTELGVEVVEVVVASSSTPGPAGAGVPTGGTTGQRLAKASDTDFDTEWTDAGTPGLHASSHEDGGADEISLTGLSGTPAALTTHEADTTNVHGIADTSALALTANHPTNATFNDHSARHENGGADEISLAGLDGTPTDLQTHLDDAADAHDASAISVLDTGANYTATDVEGVLAEIAPQLGGGAVAAEDVSVDSTTLSGVGTDAQAVFEELDNLLDDHSARHENGGADEISIAGLSGTSEALQTHLDDTTAAHAASAISADSTTLVGTGTDVQAVLEELDNGIADHLADTSDAHDASAVSVADAGGLYTGADVEAVLQEIGAWTSFSPTLEAITTDPTLGPGSSVVAQYARVGALVIVRVGIVFGSSGVNAGSGTYYINAPISIDTESQRFAGSCFTFISGTGRVGVCDLDAANDRIQFWTDAALGNVAHNVPATWVANAQLHFDVIYKAG